ncbi:carboxymuconolactone decarboxylase family protein [Thiohalocapsa marina]|nr:carboxymuconolactone decarboxylase family protein [Thiohalocapsa marina]
MIELPLHTSATAPAASRALLDAAVQDGGAPSNLMRVLADSPATLFGFQQLHGAFSQSSLSPLEQQVVYLAAAQANACHYCTTQQGPFDHSEAAREAGDAIVGDRPLRDPRLQALRRFAQALTRDRGWVPEHQVGAFLEAGFERPQILEVICGVSLATLASYTNHLAATPVERRFNAAVA